MDTSDELAPAVRSILAAAERRGAEREDRRGEGPDGASGRRPRAERVDVDPRSLSGALAAAEDDGRAPIVAEVKPTSPTTDGERNDDPVELAEAMVEGGAAALSVLTEPEHFGGSTETLRRVREAVDVPVLRKDFLLREAQLDAVEADAVLLIVRFVDDLEGLLTAARDRGFRVLVEAHTAEEFEEALEAGAEIVGVNNRDLAGLTVDLGTFERVAATVPADVRESVTLIAESGVATREDVSRLREAGADGLLVGSAIMDGPVRENTERLTNVTE